MSSDIPTPDFITSIAPEAVEVCEDHLVFPGGMLLPLSARGTGVPGMADRPWSRLSADLFYTDLPLLYSLTLRREPPDTLRGSFRARRTLFEGMMMALAEKTGRRPSMAERASDSAMDVAESVLTLGKPAFRASLMAGLFVEKDSFERALHHFQPGGQLFPGLDEPLLFLEETLPLLPAPARQVMPVEDSVWIGTHVRDGRDVECKLQIVHAELTKGVITCILNCFSTKIEVKSHGVFGRVRQCRVQPHTSMKRIKKSGILIS